MNVQKNLVITLDVGLIIPYHKNMSITERQGKILNGTVQEYINSARPVSSQLVEKKYSFRVCPATIRNEMQKLTDSGFLFQPHTSAGRVPTDKGYRFFVDSLLEKGVSDFRDIFRIEEILKEESKDTFKFAANLLRFLAAASSNLATIHFFKKDFFWKEGWEEMLKEPECAEKNFVLDFTKLLDKFEKGVKDFEINSETKIYIGRENPFWRTRDFTIISTKCLFPKREKGIISLLGPTRMTYKKNISLINSLNRVLEDF